MKRSVIGVGVVALLAGTASAQTRPYFVTDESGLQTVWKIQNGAVQQQFVTPGQLGPIIADNTGSNNPGNPVVRVVQTSIGPGLWTGQEYTPAGVFTGLNLVHNTTAYPGWGRCIDAGFDGQNTYVVDSLFGDGQQGVYRYGPNFDGPGVLMFQTLDQTDQGITYDINNNRIFTSSYDLSHTYGAVYEYDLLGNLVNQWAPTHPLYGVSWRNTSLAYDAADDTIWLNAHVIPDASGQIGMFWQFDRNGNFLQSINPNPGLLYWGGEILVPAPASAALLGIGGLLASRRRRG